MKEARTDSDRQQADLKIIDIAQAAREEAMLDTIEEILAFRADPCWHLANTIHTNDRGEKLVFGDPRPRPCLPPVYKDMSKYQVYQKSTQCGITERFVCLIMALMKMGWAVFQIWPKDESRTNFMRRFQTVISMNKHYQKAQKDAPVDFKSAVLMYMWEKGKIKAVGANSLANMKEYPADIIIIEEYDLCDEVNVAEGMHRTDNAPDDRGFVAEIGNPTVAGEGICKRFDLSDQKKWFLQCEHCGHWQHPNWFDNIVMEVDEKKWALQDRAWDKNCGRDIHVYCVKCGKPINRFGDGEWRAQNPDSDISGYHFNQIFSANKQISELWAHWLAGQYDSGILQKFYNNRLGLGYEGIEAKLTNAVLDALRDDYQPMEHHGLGCTAGIDVGNNFHVWVSDYPDKADPDVKRAIWFGVMPKKKKELVRKLTELGVTAACIDARPETSLSIELVAMMMEAGIEAFMVDWHVESSLKDLTAEDVEDRDYDDRLLKVNRTIEFDRSTARIVKSYDDIKESKKSHWIIPQNTRTMHDGTVYGHLTKPRRVYDPDHGRPPNKGAFIWKGKPDDFRCAEIYDCIAMRFRPAMADIEVSGERRIQSKSRDIGGGDLPVGKDGF